MKKIIFHRYQYPLIPYDEDNISLIHVKKITFTDRYEEDNIH
jgi:hypothetical protein